jgi:plasmid stabilization system protein ParE
MSKFRIALPAARDLEEIADYVGQRNPSAAVKLLETLIGRFVLLAKQPLGANFARTSPETLVASVPATT